MQEVKQIAENGNEVTQYYLVKSPMFFISTRDVVVRQQRMTDYPNAGEYMYAFSSCEHDQCPVVSNNIRSNNHLTGYKFVPAPEGNGVRMKWDQYIDVGGSIPEWIYKRSGQKMQVDVFNQMRAAKKAE